MSFKNLLPNRALTVAVLGSSGAVGNELLKLLEERSFPIKELRLLASGRSAGTKQLWRQAELTVNKVSESSFQDVDLVFASAGGSVSREWRSVILQAGAVMIDNSSAFRMDSDVPLVVPEVNPDDLTILRKGNRLSIIPIKPIIAKQLLKILENY